MQAAEEEERAADKALDDALADHPERAARRRAGRRRDAPTRSSATCGEPTRIDGAKEHFELGEALGMMDFEAAAKLSGSRFVVLKAGLARHGARARPVHARPAHEEHGYTEVQPPLLVKDDALFGTAQLPKFARRSVRSLRRRAGDERRDLDETRFEHPDCGRPASTARRAIGQLVGANRTTPMTADALAHPHRRSPAHQSRPRVDPRRGRAAAPLHRADAVLPLRGRLGRARTRAACCGSTSSTRSSWSRSPRRRRAATSMSA